MYYPEACINTSLISYNICDPFICTILFCLSESHKKIIFKDVGKIVESRVAKKIRVFRGKPYYFLTVLSLFIHGSRQNF